MGSGESGNGGEDRAADRGPRASSVKRYRRKRWDVLTDEQKVILIRVGRFRLVTAAQAPFIMSPLERHSKRNAEKRLRVLVDRKLLRMEPVRPAYGAASAMAYRLTRAGLRAIGRERDDILAQRPPQNLIDWLLFRGHVAARARYFGYRFASPIINHPDDQPRYLEIFNAWALEQQRKYVASLSPGNYDYNRAQRDLHSYPTFLPKKLTFEFLLRLEGKHATEVVLLVIDDPRRAIAHKRGVQRQAVPQIDDLPIIAPPGLKLLLREHKSRYDLTRGVLFHEDRRLRAWRRALVERYSEEFLATDRMFPDLWGVRTRSEGSPSPQAFIPVAPKIMPTEKP